jgi:hypothetical protein
MRALALILSLAAAPAWGQSLAASLSGDWGGEGQQVGGDVWQVVLHMHADGAVVNYPDIGCAAWWEFTEHRADQVTGTEHLAAGYDLCIDDSPIRLHADAKGGLRVTWTNPAGGVIATAALDRL